MNHRAIRGLFHISEVDDFLLLCCLPFTAICKIQTQSQRTKKPQKVEKRLGYFKTSAHPFKTSADSSNNNFLYQASSLRYVLFQASGTVPMRRSAFRNF
jgi:hypothetical protein